MDVLWFCSRLCLWAWPSFAKQPPAEKRKSIELLLNRRPRRGCLGASRPQWHFSPSCVFNLLLHRKPNNFMKYQKCPDTTRLVLSAEALHWPLASFFLQKTLSLESLHGKIFSFYCFYVVCLYRNPLWIWSKLQVWFGSLAFGHSKGSSHAYLGYELYVSD